MKKKTSVMFLGTFTLALGLFAAGCSSANKEEVATETPAATSMDENTPVAQEDTSASTMSQADSLSAPAQTADTEVARNDSLDLGASSAGRSH